MKLSLKITLAAVSAAGALVLNSCGGGCCTGEPPAPGLRPLPVFEEAPVVEFSK